MNRVSVINETRALVANAMNLRPPQAEALREFSEALARLPSRLAECSEDQRREFLTFREGWSHPYHPTFTVELATGIGKTRLAGAIMALLWLAEEAQNFLILAPRRAVLRRFEDAFNPRFREYIFVERNLVPEPLVVTSDQVDSPVATERQDVLFVKGPRVYLLSPQLVSTSERFKGRNEFTGDGLAELLRKKRDLVVIADEAHHIGKLSESVTAVWTRAIRELHPALQIGLTATPRAEAGVNTLYRYPLSRALAEGRYTKDVQLLVRQFADGSVTEDDLDRATIKFALSRLARKEEAAREFQSKGMLPIKPILVLFAKDQAHAEAVGEWLKTHEGLSPEEVLVTHSGMSKSEPEIERLLSVESSSNPVRVVVNVQELTEGWDVTNVYVVAPLRAMATFQGAVQAMGRGLRLPAGRRVGVREVDTLDVVCFGKESMSRIVEQATSWSGAPVSGSGGLRVAEFDDPAPVMRTLRVEVNARVVVETEALRVERVEPNLSVDSRSLDRVSEMVVTGVRLAEARGKVFGVDGQPSFSRESFVRAAAMRAIRSAGELLSDAAHMTRLVEILYSWLDRSRPGRDVVTIDPTEVGEALGRLIVDDARRKTLGYVSSGATEQVEFDAYDLAFEVPRSATATPDLRAGVAAPRFNPDAEFLPRFPYAGCTIDGTEAWTKGVHCVATFDSKPEAQLAALLDRSAEVSWWARNEPRRLRIRTPLGLYSPDFVVSVRDGSEAERLWLVEVKADLFWDPIDSDPRLKADAAARWCAAQTRASRGNWSFGVALEADVKRVSSWAEILPRLQV
jgi:superfamily II DNA or RNA helicase